MNFLSKLFKSNKVAPHEQNNGEYIEYEVMQNNWTGEPLSKNSQASPSPSSTPQNNTKGGGAKKYTTYKKRKYIVRVGKRGGHYIVVRGEKIYV